MMNRILTLISTAVVALAVMTPALAHHGWGGYKEDIAMRVTVSALKLGNPHDRLVATDAEGREWNLLLAPPARNRRFGFNEESLSVGDSIDLVGQKHPSRLEIKVHCINRNGENLYTYRYDNGRTSLDRQGKGDSC